MKVPKETILDLLPLYIASEASPATRLLVEEYLAQDPELAQRVRRPPVDDFSHAAPLSVPPELELRTLRRTQRRIALLRWVFAWGLAFSLCALAFQISFSPFRLHLLIFDYPARGRLVPGHWSGVLDSVFPVASEASGGLARRFERVSQQEILKEH